MRRLNHQNIVVAGGGSGIGMATAIRLAQEGAQVAVGDIDLRAAQAVVARIQDLGGAAHAIAFDIGNDDSVKQLIDTAARQLGGIDGIAVNAADLRVIFNDTDAVDIDLDVFDRTIAINLRGHLLCTRHVIPELLKRGGGSIVYTSSSSAFIGEPTRVAYAMSKSGINALMRHVASRWGRDNIRANAIAPGFVPTEKTRSAMPAELLQEALAGCRSPRLGEPGDIAAMIALLLSADGEWINGQTISVDGGSTLR